MMLFASDYLITFCNALDSKTNLKIIISIILRFLLSKKHNYIGVYLTECLLLGPKNDLTMPKNNCFGLNSFFVTLLKNYKLFTSEQYG